MRSDPDKIEAARAKDRERKNKASSTTGGDSERNTFKPKKENT